MFIVVALPTMFYLQLYTMYCEGKPEPELLHNMKFTTCLHVHNVVNKNSACRIY